MLNIPRITNNYFAQGFKGVDYYYALSEPDIGLNFHYPDCAMFALLMEIKNPKYILDLGSYFGMLPLLTEHLHKLYGESKKFDWTLIDNCSYVKELADCIKGYSNLTGTYLLDQHLETWKTKNVKPYKVDMFEQHGEYCMPPTTPDEFYKFWDKFSNHFQLDNPKKEMHTSFNSVPFSRKFDLVMFDLSAENFDENLEMWNTLTGQYVQDDAIIVMDDILPKHPKAMALFLYILDKTDFSPVAFSTNKIAMQRKDFHDKFIFTDTAKAGLVAKGESSKETYFNFYVRHSYKWGNYLNLKAN
jgi:hypothetical protein